MQPLVVFAILTLLILVIGVLAIAGVRKARSMSREHLSQLMQSGQTDRIARPKTRQDHFLRPMSLRETVVAIAGAALFVTAVQAVQSWLGW
jgi:hypothetical protein